MADNGTGRPSDNINRPKHYTQGIEPIHIIESWGLNFHLGNVIKYVCRADSKGKAIEDLEKAAWYLNREINNRSNNGKVSVQR